MTTPHTIKPHVRRLNSLQCFRNIPILVSTEPGMKSDASCRFVNWERHRYWVRISARTMVNRIQLLAHEYTHVLQFEQGRLSYADGGGWIFEGKHFPADYPYLDRPWEWEARITAGAVTYYWDKPDPYLNSTFTLSQ